MTSKTDDGLGLVMLELTALEAELVERLLSYEGEALEAASRAPGTRPSVAAIEKAEANRHLALSVRFRQAAKQARGAEAAA